MKKWSWWKKLVVGFLALVVTMGLIVGYVGLQSMNHYNDHIKKVTAEREVRRKALEEKRLRIKDIPSEMLRPCKGRDDRIADRDEDFNATDVIDDMPSAKLIIACHYPNESWYIHCMKGGYATQSLQFLYKKNGNQWEKTPLVGDPQKDCGPDDRP